MRFFSNIRTIVFAVWVMMSLIASSDVFAAAPVVVSPYNNEVLTITGTSIYPTITGTADSGSSITVEKDGNPICTATTDSIGIWSCLSTVAFTPGIYALTAISTLGDIKQVSSSISCVIIEHTLDTPVVVSPYNNEVLSITGASILPTITGTASPNTSIIVKKNGNPICTTTTNSIGVWSCVSTVAFTPGTYALSVTSSLGSQTKDSASISCVIIQYIPPPPPACTPPTLNTLSDLTLSCNSKTISDIYISGSGSAWATVTVTTASGIVVASSVVNGSGSWWATSSYQFAVGTYTLTATATLWNVTVIGASRTFTVRPATNCTPSHTPPYIAPVSNITLACGTTATSINLSGTGTPGATVTVRNSSNIPLGSALVGTGGSWTLTPSSTFPTGTLILSVSSELPGTTSLLGNTTTFSISAPTNCTSACTPPTLNTLSDLTLSCNSKTISDIYISGSGTVWATVTVTTATGVVVASSVVNGSGSWWATSSYAFWSGSHTLTATATLGAVTVIGGSRTFTVLPAPNCAPTHIAPTILSVANSTLSCAYTSDGRTFSGSGTPGATITLRNASGTVLGSSTTVGSNGTWAFAYSPFYAGNHAVRVESTLGTSTIIGNTAFFIVSPATNCTPVQNPPYIAPISNITLACGNTATSVSLTGTGTPGSTVTVKNSSGASLMTALVDSNGNWSGTTWSLLPAGNYTLSVSSALWSSTIRWNTITLTISPATNCGWPINNTTPVINPVSSLTLTCSESSRSMNFSGTGTVGAAITLRNGSGTSIATTTVGTSGTWSITPASSFSVGSYAVRVESTVGLNTIIGNTISFSISPATNCLSHTVPTMTLVSSLSLACGQTSITRSLSGSGSSGATITLRNASGTILGTTTVTATGIWLLTPATLFPIGSSTLRVESTSGNTTIVGNTISFTISSASNCGGGGSTTWPGWPSPITPITGATPLYTTSNLVLMPIVVNPQRPLSRYELAQKLTRKSLNVKPYWKRFAEKKTPTKTFLGTGPKTLTERTHIVTSKRVQTSDDASTRQAQAKKTFPYPLLAP